MISRLGLDATRAFHEEPGHWRPPNRNAAHCIAGSEAKWRPFVPDVIRCLRLVMRQPSLAEIQLTRIEERLGANRPGSVATE